MRSSTRWTTLRTTSLASCLLLSVASTWAQQPLSKAATIGGFSIVGNSIASAQQVCVYTFFRSAVLFDRGAQMFLGTETRVYIVDKTENNPTQINGHPAWAAGQSSLYFFTFYSPLTCFSEYSTDTNQGRPMDIITNSFCAVSPP